MKYTTNLNLKKPEGTDFYNVNDFNENFDILDNAIFSFYDKIITTQAEFNALVSSPTWLGAKSVLFVGEFTYNADGGKGIIIPQTVKYISGTGKTKITVTNLGAMTAFGYWDEDNTLETYMPRNTYLVNMNIEFTLGYSPGSWYSAVTSFGNVVNCTVEYTGNKSWRAVAYQYCMNMANCKGESSLIAFRDCTSLVNCNGTIDASLSNNVHAYAGCYSLTNCRAEVSNAGVGDGYGFSDCGNCSNCRATAVKTAIWTGTNTKRDDDSCDID